MVVSTVCSAAFFCRSCGRIHVHDIPYFNGSSRLELHCAACGSVQAVITYKSARWLELAVECVGCDTVNREVYSLCELRHMQLEKVYCREEHFELGYVGKRQRIEELLMFNKAEFNALHPYDGTSFMEKQQVMLEALGFLQKMAKQGDIVCGCDTNDIRAKLEGSSILVECAACGSSRSLRAESVEDLTGLSAERELVLFPGRKRGKYSDIG